jgi:RNA polymerase sigma-70 factor, ECF subfamily
MPDPSEREAALLLRQGDPRGFDLVYERYRGRIFAFLLRLCGQRSLAEDLFQETFLQLARRAPGLRADSNLEAWLFTVARNTFRSHTRARANRATDPLETAVALRSSSQDPERSARVRELERALSELDVDDRELLLLVGVEGMSQADVAEMMGVESATLRKRVTRARARLALLLEDAAEPPSELRRRSR